jgi:hypothetical protein
LAGATSSTAAQLFSVYPNPVAAGRALQVQLATAGTYPLRNALGQAVLIDSFRGSGGAVPITNMAIGRYLPGVQTDGSAATQRVTVK